MTPDDQNIAIAKACGYKDLAARMVGDPMCCGFWALCSGRVGEGGVATPNYTEDLNAMHKAEKQIEGCGMWSRYNENIKFIEVNPAFTSVIGGFYAECILIRSHPL